MQYYSKEKLQERNMHLDNLIKREQVIPPKPSNNNTTAEPLKHTEI